MSFGFSVGDFIAVGKLIADIVGSLRDVGGASSEYQELLRELDSLGRGLQCVEKLRSPDYDGIKCAALACRHPLEEFLQKVGKFEKSLGTGKSDGHVRDAVKKIQFSFGKSNDVRRLRDYLNLHMGSINMMLMSQGLDLQQVASDKAEDNQMVLKSKLEDSHSITVEIQARQRTQGLIIEENRLALSRLLDIVGGDTTARLKSLTDMVLSFGVKMNEVYSIVLDIRTYLSSSQSPDARFGFFQEPVKVEDVLGRDFLFPSEYSYEELEAIIRVRFKNGPGHELVEYGHWDFYDRKRSTCVRSSDSPIGLLPGTDLKMAMILATWGDSHIVTTDEVVSLCPMPRCRSTRTKSVIGGGVQCCECNVWFEDLTKNDEGNDGIDEGLIIKALDSSIRKWRFFGFLFYINSLNQAELFRSIMLANRRAPHYIIQCLLHSQKVLSEIGSIPA